MRKDALEIARSMTLEEKAKLISGLDFWNTKGLAEYGIPSIMLSDGPHGLRKQENTKGYHQGASAVCFPAGCAAASSFDRELLARLGKTLACECQALDVGVILGPAVNIKRSPLCGRNFEYYSEDPLLAGELAASFITAVQSEGVGTSLKHFAVNSQEEGRMTSTSEIEERTLREIYLPAFEIAVKKAKPWSVMCSYNRINGIYASSNKVLLSDILRDEWGFEGAVVSDWGACAGRVDDLRAGMDLEMPGSGGMNDRLVVKAVREGTLDEKVLDAAVANVISLVSKAAEGKREYGAA